VQDAKRETTDQALSPRRQRRRERRIRELLTATAHVLREKGYRAMTLDDVGDRLDVAKATLYHYFDGKEALVYECLRDCHEKSQEQLLPIASGEGPPRERLRRLIRQQLSTLLFEESDRAPLFLYPLDVPREIGKALDDWRHENDTVFRRVIAEGVEAGDWNAADARLARPCLYGAMNGVREWAAGHPLSPSALEAQLDGTVEVLLRLFGPPAQGEDAARPAM
jgi:AcrR family transcriptional regulator